MDKKEYNHDYFKNNKQRIYTNYKKRYSNGKCIVSDKPNWYVKRKQYYKNSLDTKPLKVESSSTKQYVIKPKTVESIEVTFWFD